MRVITGKTVFTIMSFFKKFQLGVVDIVAQWFELLLTVLVSHTQVPIGLLTALIHIQLHTKARGKAEDEVASACTPAT